MPRRARPPASRSRTGRRHTIPNHTAPEAGFTNADRHALIAARRRAEQALSAEQERLRLALDAARMGLWEWDIPTGALAWSPQLEAMHGFAPGTFGGSFEEFVGAVHPDDREQLVRAIEQALASRALFTAEFRVVWPGGGIHWVAGQGQAFYDDAGAPMRMVGIGLDITERKQAQEALRQSEERYRAFIGQSSEGIWRFELEQPIDPAAPEEEQIDLIYRHAYLAECNDAMARMYGFARAEDLAGARLEDLLIRSDPRNTDYLRTFIRSGYRLTDAESHEVDRDGNARYFLNNLLGILEDGRVARAWGSQRDITERRQIEEDRARLFAAEQQAREGAERTAERIVRLQEVSAALAGAVTPAQVAEVIIGKGLATFSADAGAIFMLDDERQAFGLLASAGYPPELQSNYTSRSATAPGPLSEAVQSRAIVAVESPEELVARWPHLQAAQAKTGDAATVAVPLLLDQRALGVLYVVFRSPRAFGAEDRAFLATLGRLCAQALDRARLYQAEQRARVDAEDARRRALFLAEASRALAGTLDYTTTLTLVARLAAPALADWCGVYILGDDQAIELLAAHHSDPDKVALAFDLHNRYPPLPEARGGVAEVVGTGRPVLLTQITDVMVEAIARDAEHLALLQTIGFASLIVVPLTTRGRQLGALAFVSSDPARRFGPDDLALAEEVGRRAAQAIDNARLYREAQEAVRLRDAFFSVAAHELKTPLTSLLGQAQLLQRRGEREGTLNERDRHTIGVVAEQASRLNKMVTALLDIGRIELGRLSIERAPLDLAALTRRVVDEIRPMLTQHTLVYAAPCDPIPIEGDALRLEQVLQNLIGNAVKYSPAGGPVEVRVEQRATRARVTIRDPGIGIPRTALQQLFQRFYRASNADERHFSGLGIGLYVVKEIVELHGGTVSVESEEGQGSAFTIDLPIQSEIG